MNTCEWGEGIDYIIIKQISRNSHTYSCTFKRTTQFTNEKWFSRRVEVQLETTKAISNGKKQKLWPH